MTLTPEQFNKLTTKKEFSELKDEMTEIKKDVKKILNSVDGLAKNFKDKNVEFVANIAAHDRFEKRITKIERHLDLKTVSA